MCVHTPIDNFLGLSERESFCYKDMFICTGSVMGQVFHYMCKLQVKVQQGRVFSVQFMCILQTRFTDWR